MWDTRITTVHKRLIRATFSYHISSSSIDSKSVIVEILHKVLLKPLVLLPDSGKEVFTEDNIVCVYCRQTEKQNRK